MTTLIDMAMLLIVFFVLVSQIGATDLVPMKLPKPVPSAAEAPGRETRCVVNAISNGHGAGPRTSATPGWSRSSSLTQASATKLTFSAFRPRKTWRIRWRSGG